MQRIQFSILIIQIISFGLLHAQKRISEDSLVIGMPVPDFKLAVDYFPKEKVSNQDFRGKWLVLDFWTMGCSACLASFPKIDQMAQDFQDNIQFLLIGKNDKKFNSNIRNVYDKYKMHYNLNLAVAYDSTLFDRFKVHGVPYIIIIDRDGIVRDITHSISNNHLNALITKNSPPAFSNRSSIRDEQTINVDIRRPLLLDGNGGDASDFIYRSLLAKWDQKVRRSVIGRINRYADNGFYQGTGLDIRWLYNIAYIGFANISFDDSLYGIFSNYPVLEIDDPTSFNEKGYFNYSLIVPLDKSTPEYLQEVMKNDLKNYFGYEVEIETRLMPYWKLTASPEARIGLKTKGGKEEFKAEPTGVRLVNGKISDLLRMIWAYHQNSPPFIDQTGIATNIDIELNMILTDLKDIKRALRKYDLDFTMGKKQMKVLVVRDSKEKTLSQRILNKEDALKD